MIYCVFLLMVFLFCMTLFMFMIAPGRHHRAENWKGACFAHRGLHDDQIPENTIAAFRRARDAGFGIELDVQVSKDGRLVVFHDLTPERFADEYRPITELTFDELRAIDLGGGHRIPTFEEVLQCVGGKVPMLVELKNCRKHNTELCEKTMAALRGYDGEYIMESFNPLILRWLKKHEPEVIRGQLVGSRASYLEYMGRSLAYILSSLSLNFLGRPDFVAYDVSAQFRAPKVQRKLFHIPMAAWTVRDDETYEDCVSRGEMPIFEGFIPKSA